MVRIEAEREDILFEAIEMKRLKAINKITKQKVTMRKYGGSSLLKHFGLDGDQNRII